MKKYIIFAMSALALIHVSCDKEYKISGIILDKPTVTIPAGGSTVLMANVTPSNDLARVQWRSSDENVATVEEGMVIGKAEGSVQITASVKDFVASCTVTVTKAIDAINLNQTAIRLKPDSVQQLTATLVPTASPDLVQQINWVSTNTSVATVDQSGKVTAHTNGVSTIVASIGTVTATCSVTVYTTVPTALMGSNYYLIYLDHGSASMVDPKNLVADYRVNDVNYNFFIWNGLSDGVKSGSNYFNTSSEWLSFVVTGAGGWSGCAFNYKANPDLDKLKAVTDDTSGKYYLHFAIKSTTSNSYAFKVGYGASAVTIVLGTSSMENTAPYGNFTRNGKWQAVEIPYSYLKSKGLVYSTSMATTDAFVMLAGGTAGVKLEIDAVFIYKKP